MQAVVDFKGDDCKVLYECPLHETKVIECKRDKIVHVLEAIFERKSLLEEIEP